MRTPLPRQRLGCFAFRVFDASLKTFWRNEPERWREERFGETNLSGGGEERFGGTNLSGGGEERFGETNLRGWLIMRY